MEWKDLEKMTVVKLREEAMKHPQIEGVHGKNKGQLMDELAGILGIEKPHVHFADQVIHTKSDLKLEIRKLKAQRGALLASHDREQLRAVRRQIHRLKHKIRSIEREAASRG